MAVEIAYDRENDVAVLYCNTTDEAFGPLFKSRWDAENFLWWLRDTYGNTKPPPHLDLPVRNDTDGDGSDARDWSPTDLRRIYDAWREEAEAA